MNRVERERLVQCQEMDCPLMPDCRVKWGKRCVKQFGNKVPRLQPGAYRRSLING